jgi:hypothetical protein
VEEMMWLVHEVKRWPLWKKSIYALGFSNFFVLGCFRVSQSTYCSTLRLPSCCVLELRCLLCAMVLYYLSGKVDVIEITLIFFSGIVVVLLVQRTIDASHH